MTNYKSNKLSLSIEPLELYKKHELTSRANVTILLSCVPSTLAKPYESIIITLVILPSSFSANIGFPQIQRP